MRPLAIASWATAIAAGLSIALDWVWWLRGSLLAVALIATSIEMREHVDVIQSP